jgi:hypothetical protein
MKVITIRQFVSGKAEIKWAGELAREFKGRPKGFPDVLIARRIAGQEFRPEYEVVKVEHAFINDSDEVEILLDTGELWAVPQVFQLQLWREP